MIGHELWVGIDLSTDQLSMMARLVLRAVENSLKALFETNILLAQNVIESDKPINIAKEATFAVIGRVIQHHVKRDDNAWGDLCRFIVFLRYPHRFLTI